MTAKVFIDGEAGTTGLQISERLDKRNDILLIRLDDSERKDPAARKAALLEADIAILCLPDAASIEAYEMAKGTSTRLLDASTAFRVNDDWAYGFAEMTSGQAERIANAQFVSNPGCYPTGAIGLLRPLRESGFLASDAAISINAVSGYTGGGKAMIAEFESGALSGHEIPEGDIEEDALRAAVVDDIVDLLGEKTRVHRVQNGPDARDGEIQLQMAVRVPGQGRDPVAGLHAKRLKRPRQTTHPRAQLAVG